MRRPSWRQVGVAVVPSFFLVAPMLGIRWQHTESLPRGLYRIDRDAPVRPGSIVLWCLDAARGRWAYRSGYLTRGSCPGGVEMLGKVVLAVSGDTIDWASTGLRVNGQDVPHTGAIVRDAAGRELVPVTYGRYVLPPGTMWLYSPYSERSLDSRYFGAISRTWVRAVVIPLLTTSRSPRD
jgi:conjugative transfer signal peptidase TraF